MKEPPLLLFFDSKLKNPNEPKGIKGLEPPPEAPGNCAALFAVCAIGRQI
jgi:hypothetical protein